jgi:3-oxoacyl-[acyl-carrier-protein] synthase II
MSDAVLVTGVGAVCPLGTGKRSVWRSFAAGEGGVRTLAGDDERLERGADVSPVPEGVRAGWVRGFHPREHVTSPQLRRMDWCSRMLVAAVRQAFDDAGLLPLAEALRPRTALVVGSCFGNQRESATYLQRVLTSGPATAQPLLFPNLVLNASAGYAAIELDVQGPNVCVAEHEASGEAALATALDLLASGACDVVCAAGVDELGSIQLQALADRRILDREALPEPQRARARDNARGVHGAIVPGEGAAALVLERAGDAADRGAAGYAVLAAARIGATPASPYGFPADAAAAAARLLALADVPGPAVSAVLGGASGLVPRDALDAAVLHALASRTSVRPGYLPFRRLVGDWGAAGALGAVLGALALDAGALPGAPGCADPQRLLLVGAAHGGVLLPVVLDRTSEARRDTDPVARAD